MANESASFSLKHVEEQKKMISDIANDIHSNLMTNSSHGKCTSDVFEGYFLPIFLGETVDTRGDWIARWQTVARTLSNRVDVVDNSGKFLFTVPPILNTSALKDRRGDDALDGILRQYQARNTNPMANADNYLLSAFGDTYKRILDKYDDSEEVKQWRYILNYYKRLDSEGYLKNDPNRKEPLVEGKQEEAPIEDPDDFLSFD